MRRRSVVLSAVLTVALAAACGSTVQQVGSAGQQNPEAGGSLGAQVGNAPGASVAVPGTANPYPGTPAPTASGGSESSAPAGTTPAGGGPSSAVGAPGSRLPAVHGMDATSLWYGYYYLSSSSANAVTKAFGINASVGDGKAEAGAIASAINKSGGIAGGRSLKLIPYSYDVSQSNAANNQAECSTWTEDNHVYAASALFFEDSSAVPCLAQHKTMGLGAAAAVGSAREFHQYSPYYVAPGAMENTDGARAYIEGLHKHGFFTPGAKIGLIRFNFSDYTEAKTNGLDPTLAKYGLKLAQDYQVSYNGDASDAGQLSAAIQNAELNFARNGVTRVLFLDVGGTIATFFMTDAQSQKNTQFSYGLSTLSFPAFLEQQSGIDTQLPKSVAVGWSPPIDTNDLASAPPNPARAQCDKIMRGSGNAAVSPSDRTIQYGLCSSIFLLRDGLAAAKSYAPADFLAAVESMGPRSSALSLGDRYAPGRPWGAASYGWLPFNTSCSCFKYVGPPTAF